MRMNEKHALYYYCWETFTLDQPKGQGRGKIHCAMGLCVYKTVMMLNATAKDIHWHRAGLCLPSKFCTKWEKSFCYQLARWWTMVLCVAGLLVTKELFFWWGIFWERENLCSDRGFSGSEKGMVLSLVITQETFTLNELRNWFFFIVWKLLKEWATFSFEKKKEKS